MYITYPSRERLWFVDFLRAACVCHLVRFQKTRQPALSLFLSLASKVVSQQPRSVERASLTGGRMSGGHPRQRLRVRRTHHPAGLQDSINKSPTKREASLESERKKENKIVRILWRKFLRKPFYLSIMRLFICQIDRDRHHEAETHLQPKMRAVVSEHHVKPR